MRAKAFPRALAGALWGSLLGCGACERTPAPVAPQAVVPAPPSASAAAPTAPPGELSVVAEGAQSLGAFSLENALVLTNPLRADKSSWDVVYRGQLLSAPDPGLVDPEQSTANDRFGGRWPDSVSLVHVWLDTWTRQDNFIGSAAYALREGKWHKLGQEDSSLYLDVWEAPRGCWLGISGDSWFDRSANGFDRDALECAAGAPPRLSVPRGAGTLIAARGLPDGGVVGARIRPPAEYFFDAHHRDMPPNLAIWDRRGAARAMPLPAPPAASTSNLSTFQLRVLPGGAGTFVVIGELTTEAKPPELLPYGARCDAAACTLLELPITKVRLAEMAEDGSILVAGEEKNEPSWTLWALPPKGSWRRVGRPPARLGKTLPTALYGSSAEDVWVTAESIATPTHSALLRSH